MRCGAKCFHVEIELDEKKLVKSVNARTPAEARKTVKRQHGSHTSILTVRERKKLR